MSRSHEEERAQKLLRWTMADNQWKAELNLKLEISKSQAKIHVARVVGAISSEGKVSSIFALVVHAAKMFR